MLELINQIHRAETVGEANNLMLELIQHIDQMLEEGLPALIETMAQKCEIEGPNQGINTFWILANNEQWELLQQVIDKAFESKDPKCPLTLLQAITQKSEQGPYQSINTFWLLANNMQWELLQQVIDKAFESKGPKCLLTLLQAMAQKCELEGPSQGISAFFILASATTKSLEQLQQVINKVLESKDPEYLSTLLQAIVQKPEQGPNQGINTFWLLANNEQWETLKQVIDKAFESKDPKYLSTLLQAMAQKPEQGPNQGINTFWLLAINQQWEILQKIINKVLESKDPKYLLTLLQAMAQKRENDGPDQGSNTFFILTGNQQWEILQKIINKAFESKDPKYLLTLLQAMAQKPEQGPNQGINAFWILAGNQQWEILQKIMNKVLESKDPKYLLTLLQAMAQKRENDWPGQGINTFWILADKMQWELLQQVIDKAFESKNPKCPLTLLQAMAQKHGQGPNQGINTFSLLVEKQQWPILEKVAEQIEAHSTTLYGPQLEKLKNQVLKLIFSDMGTPPFAILCAQDKLEIIAPFARMLPDSPDTTAFWAHARAHIQTPLERNIIQTLDPIRHALAPRTYDASGKTLKPDMTVRSWLHKQLRMGDIMDCLNFKRMLCLKNRHEQKKNDSALGLEALLLMPIMGYLSPAPATLDHLITMPESAKK
jgi:DNA-binding phage protein